MNLSMPSRQVQVAHRLVDRHPYVIALLLPIALWSIVAGLLLLLELGLRILHVPSLHAAHLSFIQLDLIGELPLALLLAALISWLGWWSDGGFARGITRKGLIACIVPFVLIAFPFFISLAAGALKAPSSTIIMVVVLSLLIGFVEEGCFRGVLLRILLPRGILLAVLLSSLFFGCFHTINLVSGFPWLYVVGEVILGVGMGVLFAAIRVRTGSIWPLILLHAIRDVPGLITESINPHKALPVSFAGIIALSILSLLFILYAVYLLRPSQLARLRVAYGLTPISKPSAHGEPAAVDDIKSE
ncbi:MAG: CPBP family intramembrane metalloprotease [Chloroflexota bacterium]|nr:CPBP family intramembrane metalloprotease [Chloroflexota bacterium]